MSSFSELILSALPQRPLAIATYFLSSSYNESFGHALNGQCVRQLIVMELFRHCHFKAVIETGTFRGSTTYFLAAHSKVPVYSVELRSAFHRYAKRRLRRVPNVQLFQGDSRDFLRQLARDAAIPKTRCFFYLDAHWNEDLPLAEEISVIREHWKEFVVMIDDFKIPGDEGYGFDTYGTGKELSIEYLERLALGDEIVTAFPAISSDVESGRKRGCVVLASATLAADIARVRSLRSANHASPVAR